MDQQSHVTSTFKNKALSKEQYTRIWIELITVLERGANERKSSNLLQTIRGRQEQA